MFVDHRLDYPLGGSRTRKYKDEILAWYPMMDMAH